MSKLPWRVLLVILGLAVARPAFAHARLLGAELSENAAATAMPQALRLYFSEPVELAFSSVGVTGPEATALATEAPSLAIEDAKTSIVPVSVSTPPAAGTYVVDWHVLSVDRHTTRGSYRLTVAR